VNSPSYVAVAGGSIAPNNRADYSLFRVSPQIIWSPVRDLDLGAAVAYSKTFDVNLPAAARPSDLSQWAGIVWVSRRF